MLKEIAITPDVLWKLDGDRATRLLVGELRRFLQEEGALRDLCDGAWSAAVRQEPLSPLVRELVEKLLNAGRLFPSTQQSAQRLPPANWAPDDWCYEALATDRSTTPLAVVLTSPETADNLGDPRKVVPFDVFPDSAWWNQRSSSLRVRRNIGEYLRVLAPLLHRAKWLAFVDPYLDPKRRGGGYANFHRLLEQAGAGTLVEIHRSAEIENENETGGGFRRLTVRDLEERFEDVLRVVRKRRLRCHFFLWEKSRSVRFHDRHLLTDLVSVGLQNGFDEDENCNETSWHRHGAMDSEEIRRQCEPNCSERRLSLVWKAA